MQEQRTTYTRLPCYTIFYRNNIRRTQKESDVIEYTEKVKRAQVLELKAPTKEQIEQTFNEESNFVKASFPDCEQHSGKLLGLQEVICEIVILDDPVETFFDVGYKGNEKALLSGHKKISWIIPNLVFHLLL